MGEDVKNLNVNQASKRSVSAAKESSNNVGLPQALREVGVQRKDIPALMEIACKWANKSGNPREVSEEQLRALYEKAY
jgi:1,3-propanediol dehydrogenase